MHEGFNKKMAGLLGTELVEQGGSTKAEVAMPASANTPNIHTGQTQAITNIKLEEDFEHARQGLTDLAEKTKASLDGAMSLAEAGDHPRAYEVVSQMATAVASMFKDLMGLHEQRAKVLKLTQPAADAPTQPSGSAQVVENMNVFVGSTKNLQDAYSKRKPRVINPS